MTDRVLNDIQLNAVRASKRSFIEIPALLAFPELMHGFTTRFGGVSTGEFESLNLNFNRPDLRHNVVENYKRLGKVLGVSVDDMVLSMQVHDKKVMPVTREHAGMGITRERSYRDIDGLITQEKGLLLVTLYADCVPLYFFDPVKKAIGLSHSGWKGTLLNIGQETLKAMKDSFDCKPGNIHVAIGPHIRQCCFEVDMDVAQQFFNTFPWAREHSKTRADRKWLLNLEAIIAASLTQSGVTKENISSCGVCTKCNKDLFYSHRGSQGKSGTGAAFMMIRG